MSLEKKRARAHFHTVYNTHTGWAKRKPLALFKSLCIFTQALLSSEVIWIHHGSYFPFSLRLPCFKLLTHSHCKNKKKKLWKEKNRNGCCFLLYFPSLIFQCTLFHVVGFMNMRNVWQQRVVFAFRVQCPSLVFMDNTSPPVTPLLARMQTDF